MAAFEHELTDRTPVLTWAWVGKRDQRWFIRELRLPDQR